MPYVHPAWLEHQRKRFTRENAHLWIRPDADRLLPPDARHLLPPNWKRESYADLRPRASEQTLQTHVEQWDAEAEHRRLRYELAALRFELALLKLDRLCRKYSPDQPRVPAGNPDGGQWTSEGGGGATSYPTDISAARRRSGGRFPEATPAQQARLVAAQAQAQSASRAVREIDPHWEPRPSLTQTIEGEIAAQRAAASEGRARLETLNQLGITRDTLRPDAPSRAHEDILAPGGRLIGVQFPRASEEIRTVGRLQFEQLRDELMASARPIETRANYPGLWFERSDGSRFGLRISERYGPTIDVLLGNSARISAKLKVHQR